MNDLPDRLASTLAEKERNEKVEPVVYERANNLGWYAGTPDWYPLCFAVHADTEDEARVKFTQSLAHWLSIGDQP